MKKTISLIQYLALLRGINVGGNNIIKMIDLKNCFETMKFSDVKTFIQSGNIIFKSDETDKEKLINKIEKVLSQTFNYNAKVVVVSFKEIKNIVKETPPDFGKNSILYKYDVIFLKEPVIAKAAIKNIRIKEGVDNVYEGKNVLYFSRLIEKASQSYLAKIITTPEYKFMTIRNWNTTTKLFALMKSEFQNVNK